LCAQRNYKENVRQKMLLEVNQQFRQDLQADLQKIQAREVLTMEQVALLLGVSRWTVNRYLKKGNIKTIQFGSRRLILRSELEKIFNKK
jgi:excisionase family DNA binding protein